MSKSKYLDIKTIKKHARELHKIETYSEKKLLKKLEAGDFLVTNFFVSIRLFSKPTSKD